MALGAFLAGMMLAETEFRHQVESAIRPFRELLLGLFFISVGMLFYIHLLLARFVLVSVLLVTVNAVILLYGLRFILAAPETASGLRRVVLNAAPLPAPPVRMIEAEAPTKKAALLQLYRGHADYGDRTKVSQVASELAPKAELQPGTARSYLYAEIDGRAS